MRYHAWHNYVESLSCGIKLVSQVSELLHKKYKKFFQNW